MKWKFPLKNQLITRIEIFALAIIGILVFLFTFVQLFNVFIAAVFVLIFFGLYMLISYITQKIIQVEEHYVLTPKHMHITRKSNNKKVTEKVFWNKIHHYKLDKFFLGGYALSNKGKHLLFFNTLKELEKFERMLKKGMKS